MSDKLAAALELASQGYRVFPLVMNGKTPVHDGNWRKIASSDPARITELWTCPVMGVPLDYNIGIALDHTTLVVDTDTRDGKQGDKQRALLEAIYSELPNTYTVDSANGGTHEYFTVEDSSLYAKKLDKDIDLKGEGGYVVAPGSTIEDRHYRARPESGQLKADLPAWVRDHAPAGRRDRQHDVEPGQPAAVELDTAAAITRATNYLAKAAPDSGTFKVAARVKDFGISRETCLELMMEHWEPAEAKGQEHVSFRVDNAYSYGQNAPGIASPEAEFDAVQIDTAKAPPSAKRIYFTPFEQARPDFDETYLIDDIMGLGSMVVTYGDSNVGKSFVALDQAYHIAAGKDWNGHKVTQGLVVYVAAEGGKGFHKRLEALRVHHKLETLPLALVPCPIDLQSERADTKRLIAVIREAETHYGQKCVLVVVDTLARAMGGGDENTSVDMSKFVVHCDRVRTELGATVNVVHHTGKDKSKGARGSSALRAATDTEIEIEKGKFHVQKQRDMEMTTSLNFDLRSVTVGRRPDGKAVTACVVEWLAESEFEARVSPAAAQFLEQFEALYSARQEQILETEEGDPASISVPWAEWKLAGLSIFANNHGRPVSDAYLYKLRRELADSGVIRETKNKQWVRGNCNLSNHRVT